MRLLLSTLVLLSALCPPSAAANRRVQALIIDGQNNHDWKATTPVLKAMLERSGRFQVDVATSPAAGGDMSTFKPAFGQYAVVISNYNGEPWSNETQAAFVKYVKDGGGFVSFHAANNAFPDWPEYNEMIGLGGWGNRTEAAGPYVRWVGRKPVHDTSPGPGGGHGTKHQFIIDVRAPKHPIMKGLPTRWKHTTDELYDKLRGPAKNLTILATAFSDPATKGTGHHEPLLMTLTYGKGRIFHTALGHDLEALRCNGFIATFTRGAEWSATGRATIPLPAPLPSARAVSVPLE